MSVRIAVATVVAAITLAAAAVTTRLVLGMGPTPPAGGVEIVVRDGDGLPDVATRLEGAGVIRSALAFRVSARVSGRDRAIQPGLYRFTTATDLRGVLAVLAAGTTAPEVTVPEGLTVRDVATLLATRGYGDADAFLCLADDPDFLLAAGVPGPRLEGYLFPDTYRFAAYLSPGEILATMVRRFQDRFDPERRRRAAARGLSVDQVVTLASIIEKETGLASERPLIAAVFANRLRLGMPLQSDPTVIYGIPSFNGDLTRADLARPTPYNTYQIGGLPPGPIANPGLSSIDAALAPADSLALYFVSRNDGSHEFSTTLAEHNRAVARYQHPAAP